MYSFVHIPFAELHAHYGVNIPFFGDAQFFLPEPSDFLRVDLKSSDGICKNTHTDELPIFFKQVDVLDEY